MKKALIYIMLWLFVAVIWYILNQLFGNFFEIWYMKLIYSAIGIGVIFLGGDAMYNRLFKKEE